jgi:inhibitor of KinA
LSIEWLGDAALIVRNLPASAYQVADWVNEHKPPGVDEAVASYDTLGVYLKGGEFDLQALEERIARFAPPELIVPTRHEIPVCYELGEDLLWVSKQLELTPLQLVHEHCHVTYTCYAVGFCPGFPYLGYLPDALSGLARRAEPRLKVAPGSVAITGNQTGVYPLERPGGWHLIGRTPLELVNVREEYFPISAGDEVVFVPISLDEYRTLEGKRL